MQQPSPVTQQSRHPPSLHTCMHRPCPEHSKATSQVTSLTSTCLDMYTPKKVWIVPHPLGIISLKALLILTLDVFRVYIPHVCLSFSPAPASHTSHILWLLLCVIIGYCWHLPKDPHIQTLRSTILISLPGLHAPLDVMTPCHSIVWAPTVCLKLAWALFICELI